MHLRFTTELMINDCLPGDADYTERNNDAISKKSTLS